MNFCCGRLPSLASAVYALKVERVRKNKWWFWTDWCTKVYFDTLLVNLVYYEVYLLEYLFLFRRAVK